MRFCCAFVVDCCLSVRRLQLVEFRRSTIAERLCQEAVPVGDSPQRSRVLSVQQHRQIQTNASTVGEEEGRCRRKLHRRFARGRERSTIFIILLQSVVCVVLKIISFLVLRCRATGIARLFQVVSGDWYSYQSMRTDGWQSRAANDRAAYCAERCWRVRLRQVRFETRRLQMGTQFNKTNSCFCVCVCVLLFCF